MPDALRFIVIGLVAAVGSMVNAIAGGGTLLTFPAIIALGIPPIVANATSTVALWPGALGSMLGYRHRMAGLRTWALVFAAPSLVGGGIGAWLLLITPAARFANIVPWLVLGATLLFAVQQPFLRWVRARRAAGDGPSSGAPREERERHYLEQHPNFTAASLAAQFGVGIYGGYFGAGIGILMLAVLGFSGLSDIHRMNGLKNWGGLCINFVAALIFAFSGIVDWTVALAMAVGATAGGYIASRGAQRIPQVVVRRIIVGIGAAASVWLYFARFS
jgi:hypothetical protein